MITFAAASALALAACDAPADDTAADPAETAMPDQAAGGMESGTTPPAGGVSTTEADTESIPAALQGRWGLVAADCTSTRGDAKGLIDVSEDKVTFYESRATLGDIAERTDDTIRATFALTGEGMTWNRDMALEAQDGGNALVRTEFGEEAMPEPLRYTKCPNGDA